MTDPVYTPADWYWIIAGSTTQVYSSAVDAYVPVSNSAYVAWLGRGNLPAKLPNTQELADVLAAHDEPLPAGSQPSDEQKQRWFDDVPHAVQVWAFDVDNRVRVLEGQPTRTLNQFKNYVKGLL